MNCPAYYTHLHRQRSLQGQAYQSAGYRRFSLLYDAEVQRKKAHIALAHCRSGTYGACGHCGTSSCPDGEYGGCGTFFGKTKNADKRSCYLEKKIAKHQECCDQDCSWWTLKGNQDNQCRKIAEWEAELAAIQQAEYGPQTFVQATDLQAQKLQAEIEQGNEQYAMEQARNQRTLIIAGGGMALALLAVLALR